MSRFAPVKTRGGWLPPVGLAVTCLALWLAPDRLTNPLRAVVQDLVGPGLMVTNVIRQYVLASWENRRFADSLGLAFRQATNGNSPDIDAQISSLKAELAMERQRAAAWMGAAVREHESARGGVFNELPIWEEGVPRLLVPVCLEAAVLGPLQASDWRSGQLLNRGERDGVRESAWVLQPNRPLLDVGETLHIAPDDLVLLGRAVVGKVERVGRWTSTYRSVSDRDFRVSAQLIRVAGGGVSLSATGWFKGTGEATCQLEGIDGRTAVAIGDYVGLSDRDGVIPVPLVLGIVTQCELSGGERTWKIAVKPLASDRTLTRVAVLRSAIAEEPRGDSTSTQATAHWEREPLERHEGERR